jgi:membrane protein implicated in regulation of membrane protease activity
MEWISDHLAETWLIAAVGLAVVELISLDLIFVMLAIGCVVGMLTALLGLPGAVTLVFALGSAVGLLAFLRPGLVKTLHAGPDLVTGPAALIGRPVQVLTMLTPGQSGRVKIGGEEWTAAPYDEFDEIEPGERAEVVEIRGATAYVRRA